jgi:ADP-ribose pyrophosphatase YjhB (NUDIX family)
MVRRKHSLNYIEFIRGKYELDNIRQNNNFELMSINEIIKIKTKEFDTLWNDLWKETATHKYYMKEYMLSKNQFNELKQNNFYNLLDDMNNFKYMEPEWGFPKGRRNTNEQNVNCAIREFNEETHIDLNNLYMLERANPMEENFVGTNSKNYRHVYYMANSAKELKVSSYDVQLNEIGDIGWFTIPQVIERIRSYNDKRIKMINQLYFFLINMIVNISKDNDVSITI